MELREKIAKWLYERDVKVLNIAHPVSWDELPDISKDEYKKQIRQILALIEQEYEPVQLGPLTDEEIATACGMLSINYRKVSQATIAKNQKGQLYRRRELNA